MNTDTPTGRSVKFDIALNKLPKSIRGHVVAMLGELIGTLSFIFFAFAGTQTANIASNNNTGTTRDTTTTQKTPSQLLFIALSFGFSLTVNAWVFFRVSGGLFNPAVTLGMVLIGAITWFRGVLLFIMQMAGSIAGAYMVDALFTGGLNVNTTLSATTTIAQGVIIEMLLTTLLCFTIFMLAAEKHVGNFIAPVGIGLSLFISELVGVFWTGGSLNPARSFSPGVVSGFNTTQWIYWVGPICGSILAVIIYKIIKALEYETANPDPEAPSPTGPAVAIVDRGNVDSGDTATLRNEGDLEKGYSNKEYSDTDTGDFMRNANGNNTRRPSNNRMASNSVLASSNNVPMARFQGGFNIHPHPQYAMPPHIRALSQANVQQAEAVSMTPVNANGPLNYGNERNMNDGNWNQVHTANAIANTHTAE